MALREILVELGIDVDDKGAEQAIEGVRNGLRRMAAAEERSRGGLRGLMSRLGTLRNVAIGAGAVLLTGKLAQGMSKLITTAGDAAETANKFGAVFVEETDRVGASLAEMAKRTGQSRVELQGMAADAGSLVKPLLGDNKATAELSERMTEAALDISSFENVLPTEALGAMKSAIIGSSEPMLRFGVDTRQAALQQFALSKGITKSVKEMSTQQITALRMELIMKRLTEKGAIGDATKTAGSFTNKLRALRGAFIDLQVELGKEFLPVATELLHLLVDFVRLIGPGLAKGARVGIGVLRTIGGVVQALFVPFQRLDTALLMLGSVTLLALGIAFKTVGLAAIVTAVKAAAAWFFATLPVILMIALFAVLAAAIILVIEDLFRMGEGHESVTGTMIDGINDLIDEWGGVGPAIGAMLDEALRFWLKFFGMTDEAVDDWVEDLIDTLNNMWKNVFDFWGGVFDSFAEKILGWLRTAGEFYADLFGFGDDAPNAPPARERVAAGTRALQQAGQTGTAVATAGGLATQPPRGGTTVINQPNNTTTVDVDASGNADPQAVGQALSEAVRAENERRDRQTLQAFTVAVEAS